jgi:hypothetical protein
MDDQAEDQLSLKEFIDPFTGEPIIKGNKNDLVISIIHQQ